MYNKDMKNPIILIFYKYTSLARPRDILVQQRALCLELGLRGRILIAREGINATLEGDDSALKIYCAHLNRHPELSGIRFKRSQGTGNAFPRLVVKVRKEIVTSDLGDEDVDPTQMTGEHISAEKLHEWLEQGRKFKIVDMRNDYEQIAGRFDGSIMSGMQNFRDLKVTAKNLEHLKDEKVVTVCTSGVRCEKASGYLMSQGYMHVYQLEDGIAAYMEKFPNQHFKGKLYVFDGRIMMGFGTESSKYESLGRCALCGGKSENYTNCAYDGCRKHFICCENCMTNGLPFCKKECELELKQTNNELQKMAI
jgi:UPF0176 protein